jgi:hypothetical protein
MNVPKNAVNAINFHCNKLIFDRLLNPTSIKKNPAKSIRNETNCIGDKPIRPFLMRINELPQIKERIVRSTHLSCLDSIK